MAPNPAAFLGAHVPRKRHVAGISPNRPTSAHKRLTPNRSGNQIHAMRVAPNLYERPSAPCRSRSRCTTSPITNTIAMSRSGRRSCGCARRRIAAPRVPSYSLKITPAQHFINWQQDPHGNWLARLVVPEKTDGVPRRGRSDRRSGGYQSVRLLRRALRRGVPLRLRARARAPSSPPIWRPSRSGRCSRTSSTRSRAKSGRTIDFLVGLNARLQPGDQLCHPHGARRADAGRDADAGLGLLPRFGLAAGADRCAISASPRVSSPAISIQLTADVEPLEGPTGTGSRFHRSARLGRGLSARRRLDRPRPDLRPVRGEGHLPLCADAALPLLPRRSRALVEPAKCEFGFEMRVERIRRGAARHRALLRRGLGAARRARRTGRRRSRRAGRAPDHGRRADLRLDRRFRRRRNGTPRRSARPSARSPTI